MKKRSKIILGISIPLILLTGGMMMTQRTPFDIFLTKDFTKPTKEQQIDYLKKHEQEMTEFVKSQNPKVESVQWDWESVKVEKIQPNAGGIPTGKKYNNLTIEGKFNKLIDSTVTLNFNFNVDKIYPSMNDMVLSSDSLRVVKEINGTKVGVNYE